MGYSEHYKKEEEKMNLGEKYKQLFEGKIRSNDSKLLINEFFNVFADYENEWEGMEDTAQSEVEDVEGMSVDTKYFGEFEIEHGTIHLGSRFNRHKGEVDIIARAQDPEFKESRIEFRIHMEANGEGSQKYKLDASYKIYDIDGNESHGYTDDATSFTSDEYIHNLVINKIREMLDIAGEHMDEEEDNKQKGKL